MNVTIELLAQYQDDLKKQFGPDESIAYANVTQTQFSIARHYGGVMVSGKHFVYNPTDDSLIRDDVLKWFKKHTKKEKTR